MADRAVVASLRDWFEKTIAIVDVLGDRMAAGNRVIESARRGPASIDTAIDEWMLSRHDRRPHRPRQHGATAPQERKRCPTIGTVTRDNRLNPQRFCLAFGVHRISGTVESWSQRQDAERAVRNLVGVETVQKKIVVKPAKPVLGDVRKAIEQALERRAEREARRIQVDVRDGTVSLTGSVQSWAERKSVLSAVGFTPGVQVVEDHLRTEPG